MQRYTTVHNITHTQNEATRLSVTPLPPGKLTRIASQIWFHFFCPNFVFLGLDLCIEPSGMINLFVHRNHNGNVGISMKHHIYEHPWILNTIQLLTSAQSRFIMHMKAKGTELFHCSFMFGKGSNDDIKGLRKPITATSKELQKLAERLLTA